MKLKNFYYKSRDLVGGLTRPGLLLLFIIFISIFSCKKFVTRDELNDRILTEQVYSNEATANSAINGIYKSVLTRYSFTNSLNYLSGLSADELNYYPNTLNNYQNNSILPTEYTPWSDLYSVIYQCNVAIEGLNMNRLSSSTRDQFLGEALFLRALNYFYLVNLFGDVPLAVTPNVEINASLSRTAKEVVNNKVLEDLVQSEQLLADINPYAKGEKIRVNKWGAKALLARFYLYRGDWKNAFKYADDIIKTGPYILQTNLSDIFKKNSSEAVLQFAFNSTESMREAGNYIFTTTPHTVLSNSMLSAFESGDLRKTIWTKSVVYSGNTISYPFKYTTVAVNPTEYFMAIRIAEIYLIRAEANARQNEFQGAIDDVNLLRLKHGGLALPLIIPTGVDNAVNTILKERRIELFGEMGHRWLDLKRTGTVDAILSAEKPGKWKATASLWPLPTSDIKKNPKLIQNLGYTK